MIGHELPVLGKLFHRLPFPVSQIRIYILEDARFQDKKSAVDPPLSGLWLLREFHHPISIGFQVSETRRRPNSCQRGKFPMFTVKG